MTPELAEAIEVFRELGWEGAPLDRAPDLPIGTPEQQRRAREGLRRGEWGHFGQIGENTFTWVSDVQVDAAMLGLFAIRVGVDARRALDVAPSWHASDDRVLQRIVSARGQEFAARFVELGGVRFRDMVVRLVVDEELPVPEVLDYLEPWSWLVEAALRDGGEVHGTHRFADHARAAVAVGLGCTAALPTVFPEGVRRGWLDRDEAVALAFTALDSAVRPGDRKGWAKILVDDLAVTDHEMLARADALAALLATGEAPLVESFGVRLLGVVPDDLLPDVLAASLTARTKKALRAVLAAAAVRRPPPTLVGELLPFLAPLVADGDKALAAAARKVVDAWGADPVEVVAEVPVASGRWQPTPRVWEVPHFEVGEVTPEALTDAAAILVARREMGVDVAAERFLALANQVARADRHAAQRALRGVPDDAELGMRAVAAWAAGDPVRPDERRPEGPLHGRLVSVMHRLGELPNLLSTPSRDDLRLDPSDLVERLGAYRDERVDAVEADALLAILRLDPALLTDAARTQLKRSKVRARTSDGRRMRRPVGALALAYVADRVHEPEVVLHGVTRQWTARRIVPPASLKEFPPRLQLADHNDEVLALWPQWEMVPAWALGGNLWPRPGLAWRQLVRRASPLSPGAAINLLGALRNTESRIAADVALAVREAWERGLLLPGTADVRFLDWSVVLTHVAALAAALAEIAEDGLASVVWPVYDDLLTASLAATRLAAGTAEVAEAMRDLVPEALAAVASGVADESVLAVPGLRALASRGGSSRAVVAAREAVALLPAREPAAVPRAAEPVPEVDLSAVWPEGAGALPAVPDGARLTAEWEDPTAGTRMLAFDLVLPDAPGKVFRVVKGWTYDLETEGQCEARDGGARVYLYWDGSRLAVSEHRDRVHAGPGPLQLAGPTPPLTTSMVAVAVGMVGQDGDRGATGERLLEQLVRTNRIGAAAVRIAMGQLLTQADVSPARLVRVVEKRPHLLPTLWPLLTEPIRVAGLAGGPPPRWLNQVLVIATAHASTMRAAAETGRLPEDVATWPGLAELAARPGTSAALEKARSLQTLLS